jgi:hypothetical protein
MADHFGKFLRDKVELSGLKKQDFAEKIGVKPVTLRSWFGFPAPAMKPENRVRLAAALGMSLEQLDAEWAEANLRLAREQEVQKAFESGAKFRRAVDEMARAVANRADAAGVDQNVEPYSEQPVPRIPTFDLPLAAGPWVEVEQIAEIREPGMIDQGLFRVRLRGDSMSPEYPDGQVVEFKCLRVEYEGAEVGRDYYVQKSDGTATFKRLDDVTEDELVLVAINRMKYPEPMRVARGLVVRMAAAVARIDIVGAGGVRWIT